MRNSPEKTGSDLIVLAGILFLIAIAHTVAAQIDTTNKKPFAKDTLTPVKFLLTGYSFTPHPGNGAAQLRNPPPAKLVLAPYHYKESNTSTTILKILGIGALSIFGDRTNHQYNPYKPY